jgi:sugar phosphate permease
MPKCIDHSKDSHRWIVFGVFSFAFILAFFHRVSTSVIATDLLSAFHVQAAALGIMSSMYFYTYALEQPFVGHLSDSLGPRRVLGLWSLIASLGCVLFSIAPNVLWAGIGRGLMGFGVGGVVVPAMKAFSQWFGKREFSTITGFFLAIGNIGGVMATSPLAFMATTWGWRVSFLIMGGVTLAIGLVTLFLVRDPAASGPEDNRRKWDEKPPVKKAALKIIRSLRFWITAAIFFGSFGASITFQGLWATSYIVAVLGVDRLYASGLNMIIPLGAILGAPLCGWLSDRVWKNSHILLFLLLIQMLTWGFLAFFSDGLNKGTIAILLFIVGLFIGGLSILIWTLVEQTTEQEILGLVTGLLNPFPILGMAVFQSWTGAFLETVGKARGLQSVEAYQSLFACFFVVTAACVFLFLFLKRLELSTAKKDRIKNGPAPFRSGGQS